MPEYYDRYIRLVEDLPLMEALAKSLQTLSELDVSSLRMVGDKAYAPGKWTVKDVLQHMMDTERVFAYRALRFARGDSTPLPGFEQDDFARSAAANRRTVDDLLEEFLALRRSTIRLFASFDDAMLLREGTNAQVRISVLAQGYTIIGHQIHHLDIIRSRYLTLA